MNVKLVFTKYDNGNAFARFMLAGFGQIRISANVLLIEPTNNQTVGEFEVSKDFSFGGVYGGTTRVEDVEDGFARSVASASLLLFLILRMRRSTTSLISSPDIKSLRKFAEKKLGELPKLAAEDCVHAEGAFGAP